MLQLDAFLASYRLDSRLHGNGGVLSLRAIAKQSSPDFEQDPDCHGLQPRNHDVLSFLHKRESRIAQNNGLFRVPMQKRGKQRKYNAPAFSAYRPSLAIKPLPQIILCGIINLYTVAISAAPQLQMHVFDQPAETTTSASPSTAPKLHMHIFQPKEHQNRQPIAATSPVLSHNIPRTRKQTLSYTRADIYFKTGYRRDELDWNIAGPNGTPNILSELSWDDLEIATINAGATLYTGNNWLFNLDLVYGRIYNGDNQDSDYLGDNRTFEFSRSNNGADEGDVYDISVYAGYRWQWLQNNIARGEVRPLLGLSYHAQNLKIVNGFQTLPAFGPFSGLDSSYDATWFGPWLGLDTLLSFTDKFNLTVGVEYHYAFYDATANWNLRTDFAHPESFTHEAEGYGLISRVEARYQLDPRLTLDMSLNYQHWQADRNGKDKTFFADGTSAEIELNEVNWRSFGANLGITYAF
ncbi:TonB-dependent receptor [Methylophaga sp. OBS4]|uniref:TonB-dependent receptor n=1 Tax=Methylophaga sp. OBS4 TaxID=2991935 RepID=UPI0022554D4D|nr:TonB-dependent receptor [Methylophaga sp. OBS4]MCX4187788.1 TonB-dependent receptor [Methylophaga sp. OBS4]